jgi:hypothetical protein
MSGKLLLVEFATHLRKIVGLRLFKIFSKYHAFSEKEELFNFFASHESEADLRELERLWEEFIQEKDTRSN